MFFAFEKYLFFTYFEEFKYGDEKKLQNIVINLFKIKILSLRLTISNPESCSLCLST